MKRSTPAGAIGAATIGTAAALAAGVAGACCVGPAIAPIFLAVLGSTGLIALSTLRPYTPWMLLASAAMLAFSIRHVDRAASCAGPRLPLGLRVARTITWIAVVVWVVSAAYAVYGLLHE